MSIRSPFRARGDLRARAVRAITTSDNADAAGRDQAYELIRQIHAQNPRAGRTCIVPNCCDKGI